jgi:MFS family permease
MQQVALSWLVYQMTKSALMLGVVGFAGTLPLLLFTFAGGMIADRFPHRNILIVSQMLAMLQALILAYLTLTHMLAIWHVVLLSFFLGLINAVDMPTRQAMVADLVGGGDDLVNAIGLNSSLFQSSRIIGPALAGILVSTVGEGPCFVINALSFLGMLVALLTMNFPNARPSSKHRQLQTSPFAALSFVRSSGAIRNTLWFAAVNSLFGMQYFVLMPVFAQDVLHVQASSYGFLTSAAGLGACVAALSIARFGSGEVLYKGVGWASLMFSIALLIFSQSKVLPLSLVALLFCGFFMTVILSGNNSLVQLRVDDHLRGRVMSLYTTAAIGLLPIGNLIAGYMAHIFQAPTTIGICACITFLSGILYLATSNEDKHFVQKAEDNAPALLS